MGFPRGAHQEKMTPVAQIVRDDETTAKRIGKERPGDLWRDPLRDQRRIARLTARNRLMPERMTIVRQIGRLNKTRWQFFLIIHEARTLLGIAAESMPDPFVAHTAVNRRIHRHAGVFRNTPISMTQH